MARKRKASTPIADDGYEPAEVIFLDEPAGNSRKSKNILFASAALERDLKLAGKRGRRQEHPWGKIRTEIVLRIFNNGRPKWPKSEDKLAWDIEQRCLDEFGKAPAHSELRAMVAAVVEVLRVLLS